MKALVRLMTTGLVLASCALAPLSSSSPQPTEISGPLTTPTPASTVPTLGATPDAVPPTTEPTSSSAVPSAEPTAGGSATVAPILPLPIDLSSAGWFQWLDTNPDYTEASLWAGRLDGRSFEVVHGSAYSQGVGSFQPGHGTVLTSWVMDDAGSIDLVDTATGVRSNVARFTDYTVGTFDATGSYIYWIEWDGSGEPTGLWRRSTSLEAPERVMDGRDVPRGRLTFSSDGKYMAFSVCRDCGPGTMESNFDYAVFDARFRLVGELKNTSHGRILGFLGDRLVVYPHFTDDGSGEPLSLVDMDDWSSEEIAASVDFGRAAILRDIDGTARLVFDGFDGTGQDARYMVKVLDSDGVPRILFTGEAPFHEAPETVLLGSGAGIHAPGWVAVFPRGEAMSAAVLSGGDQGVRRLIRISDGVVVEVPPLSVQP